MRSAYVSISCRQQRFLLNTTLCWFVIPPYTIYIYVNRVCSLTSSCLRPTHTFRRECLSRYRNDKLSYTVPSAIKQMSVPIMINRSCIVSYIMWFSWFSWSLWYYVILWSTLSGVDNWYIFSTGWLMHSALSLCFSPTPSTLKGQQVHAT